MSGVDVLAAAIFAAYSRNSGNPPEAHFDRSAAEQWMAQALTEYGVAELIEAASDVVGMEDEPRFLRESIKYLRAALANVTGGAA